MSKKDLEADYFERFKRARPELDLGGADHADAPDFLIQRDGSSLGVEVTRFSLPRDGSPFIPEEQDSLRDRVLELAQAAYYTENGLPLHVQALFNDHRPLVLRRVAPLADELVAFLLAKSVGVLLYDNVPFSPGEKYPYMAEIGALTAVRVPERSYGAWYAGQGAWVRKAELSDFERVLAEKEPLLQTYRMRANEVWLLVVFETMPGGTYVEVPPSVSFRLRTEFDRVFALERLSSLCVEIPIVRP